MKNLSAIFLATTLLLPSINVSATEIESNLLTEFGGETGYGEKVNVYFPDIALFEKELPFSINVNGTIAIYVAGDITGYFELYSSPVFSTPGLDAPFEQFPVELMEPNGFPFSGSVYSGVSEGKFSMTWDNIQLNDPTDIVNLHLNPNDSSPDTRSNTFQLVLIDREDTGESNFDVEFRYDNIDWWSESHLLITPETAFKADGNIETFQVRNGVITPTEFIDEEDPILPPAPPEEISAGEGTPDDPFMPIANDDDESESNSWNFAFGVTEGDFQAIDPDVAVGYEYVVNSGPSITSVILPTGFDNNLFDIFTKEGDIWELLESDWQAGEQFDFAEAVREFKIEGIDISNAVDPLDPQAFVTQIAFDGSGYVDMTQTALTEYVDDTAEAVDVPEPQTLFIFSGALGLLALLRKRKLKIG